MTICTSCEQPYGLDDFCIACQQHASEQPPEKTLDQLLAEHPDLRAYRDEIRARLREEWALQDRVMIVDVEQLKPRDGNHRIAA